jgi:hypothetical protein
MTDSTSATQQNIYDAYNTLIFSGDNRVFNKMTKKIELYHMVKHLSGDILEFGVFKGAGLGIFLNLKGMYEPNSLMKVIGFDYFNPTRLSCNLDGLNKLMMTAVLNRVDTNDLSRESVEARLSNFSKNDYILIEGDAVVNAQKYDLENPGARIKLMYMDLDLGDPTYAVMKVLWKKVVNGGLIVFDEYAYHKWDESEGVDRFLKEIPGEYEFIDTKISSPTAYLRKINI